jgi:hypothetical protein
MREKARTRRSVGVLTDGGRGGAATPPIDILACRAQNRGADWDIYTYVLYLNSQRAACRRPVL